jgi:hypothetical protein
MNKRKKKWTEEKLIKAVKKSTSIREVILKLGLIPAGGNYEQVKKYIGERSLDTSHFTGKGWRTGMNVPTVPALEISKILTKNSFVQSYKLKRRLFKEGLKTPTCEECGWAVKANDGRVPLELDHINGDKHDNRLENLRILCPNCHSLKPTHRGRNIGRRTLSK